MLTAVDVRGYVETFDGGVTSVATVGLGTPVLAAAPDEPRARAALVGTVNVVVFVPARLSDAAMVNAVATVAEAKAQALRDLGLDATGTATDAVCVACPSIGRPEPFGGPRSTWGARLARAVHVGVLAGAR
jgi:adenosylcobinamide amidohydrolase